MYDFKIFLNVFIICFHISAHCCHKKEIVLRGPKLYRDGKCHGCEDSQVSLPGYRSLLFHSDPRMIS